MLTAWGSQHLSGQHAPFRALVSISASQLFVAGRGFVERRVVGYGREPRRHPAFAGARSLAAERAQASGSWCGRARERSLSCDSRRPFSVAGLDARRRASARTRASCVVARCRWRRFSSSSRLRYWAILSLGENWNTRVLVVPGGKLVRRGPYRYFPHPNYVVVAVEVLTFPLIFGAWITAIVFSLLNAALLYVRIRTENRALRELAG